MSTSQMMLIIFIIIAIGSLHAVVMYFVVNNRKKDYGNIVGFFGNNKIPSKMINSDVSIDDIIDNFKLSRYNDETRNI